MAAGVALFMSKLGMYKSLNIGTLVVGISVPLRLNSSFLGKRSLAARTSLILPLKKLF